MNRNQCVPITLARKVLRCWVVTIPALLVLGVGCGGHGGSGSLPGSTTTTGSLSGPTGAGVVTPGSITPAQKAVMLGNIRTQMQTLGPSSPNFGSQMVTFLKGMTGVYTAEVQTDSDISVVFTDGQWLTIFNNQNDSTAGPIKPFPVSMPAIPPTPGSRDLPTGKATRIINYFSGQAAHTTPVQNISAMFADKSYGAPTVTDASIENFWTSGATVTYVDTHGGVCDFLDPTDSTHKHVIKSFGLLTNTSAPFIAAFDSHGHLSGYTPNPVGDAGLIARVNSGQIGLGFDPEDTTDSVLLCLPPTYIASAFLFPGDGQSILVNTACESSSPAAVSYAQTCFTNGVGIFTGWTVSPTSADAVRNAQILLQNTLGTHEPIAGSTSRGRAWSFSSVMSAMGAAGLNQSTPQTIGGTAGLPSTMIMSTGPSNTLTSLAPGIQLMYTIESQTTNNLVIDGEFGGTTVAPTVTVNGTPVTVESGFTETEIKCDVPNDPSAATFSGPVVVTINGIKSNQVSLTKYTGNIHYEFDAVAQPLLQATGTTTQSADMKFIGRADVHLYRANAYTDEATRPQAVVPCVDKSVFTDSASGSFSYAGGKATTSVQGGTTLLSAVFHGTSGPNYAVAMTLKQASQVVQLSYTFTDSTGETTTLSPPGRTTPLLFQVAPDIYDGYVAGGTVNPIVSFPMNMDFTIPDFVAMQQNPVNTTSNPFASLPPGIIKCTAFLTAKGFVCTPAPDTTKQEDESN